MENKPSPLNIIWLMMILLATLAAAYLGRMDLLTKASFESAKDAVTLAIGLVGAMALWLGIMKVAEESGLMRVIARGLRPIMIRLFPDVPENHPAMSAMIMNMAANALGLGNAATPMGIKAMQELDKLNKEKGTATNAMCLFLAINTSSVTLLPLGVIAVRAAAGASGPADILLPSIFATTCSTAMAILAAKLMARRSGQNPLEVAAFQPEAIEIEAEKPSTEAGTDATKRYLPGRVGRVMMFALMAAFGGAIAYHGWKGEHPPIFSMGFVSTASNWLIPTLICAFLLVGYFKGVRVYECLTDGAKEGFNVALKIIPFMVAIFVAAGMFRASGAMELLAQAMNPITSRIGMPSEVLPVVFMRPLSGSGSFALVSEIINRAPDSFASFFASVVQGCSETTFYVLAVYFGSVGIRRTRHALPAALVAEGAGVTASLIVCHLFF